MTSLPDTPGDDIIIIDNNVITLNGVVYMDPLTRITVATSGEGNDTIIIKDSSISMESIFIGPGDSLEIINSDVTVVGFPNEPNAGLHMTGATVDVTDSTLEVQYFEVEGTGGQVNNVTFTDSTLEVSGGDGFTPGIRGSRGDDNITFVRSEFIGDRRSLDLEIGDDSVTLIVSRIAGIVFGAGHNDTLTIQNSEIGFQTKGNGGNADAINLPKGTVVTDVVHGTFTVVAGQSYSLTNGSYTLPTGQTNTYIQFHGGDPVIVCFCQDTLIGTENGNVAVQDLSVGDMIMTDEGEARPLRWIGRRKLNLRELQANDKLYPVRISAGSLGNGLPEKDLLVSRQHRMLVRSGIVQRMFGLEEVLIPAIKLTALPGIFVDASVETVTYFHLLLDEHSVILAEGTPAESLATGPQAMKALSPEAREEIRTLFPAIFEQGYEPEFARPVPEGRRQRALIQRHLKNGQPLLSH